MTGAQGQKLAGAWDDMDSAAQRVLTAQPHQMTSAAERLDAARLAMRSAVHEASLEAQARPDPAGLEEVARISASDWQAKIDELYQWTGSAFLAGERISKAEDRRCRSSLYTWLCGLGGYLMGAQEEALLPSVDAERERCAKIADAVANRPIEGPEHGAWERATRCAGRDIAAAIRAGSVE